MKLKLRPFWLSPRQIVVIPVAAPFKEYAQKVAQKFWDAGLFAEADLSDNTLNKKIRNGQTAQWNFIMGALTLFVSLPWLSRDLYLMIVVGQDEFESDSVNIRNRDDEVQGREETVKVDDALIRLLKLKSTKAPVGAKLE